MSISATSRDNQPWTYHSAGDWIIRTQPNRSGSGGAWFGYAKRRRDGFCADDAVSEPISHDVYFEFGDTEAEVALKLKRELLN